MSRMIPVLLALCSLIASAETRRIRFEDIPASARVWLGGRSASPKAFDAWVQQIVTSSEERLRDGEWDERITQILEPAAFRLPATEGEIPSAVRARIAAEPSDQRVALERAYHRVRRFVHEREVASQAYEGDRRRRHVAALYQQRGFSTDTGVASSFGVFVGLGVIRSKVARALVVGPGRDPGPPAQSTQPYLLADTLLRLNLASPEDLQVHCVDVNPSVVELLGRSPVVLRLNWETAEEEHRQFFGSAGAKIGSVLGEAPRKQVEVSAAVARRVSAARCNIITERLTGVRSFDLAVATN
ncbi:MAG: hypothetical protein ACRD44_10840, partial [Bryobacteraceae bacterium]